MKESRYFRGVAAALAVYMLFLSGLPAVQASMISTTDLIVEQQVSVDREYLVSAFDREDVRLALKQRGVDIAKARERVASLTDEEVAIMKQRIDDVPAGGSALGTVAIIFLVLLFTDIMGWTDIFPFVNKK